MNNYYYTKENNVLFQDIYENIKQKNDIILDIVKEHGMGFYKLNPSEIEGELILPSWYIKAKYNKIKRIIIKNIDYIGFETTGFQLCLELISNRTLTITKDIKYKIPDNIDIIIIPDFEWINFLKNYTKKNNLFLNLKKGN